jgi:hypothetical protein
MSDTIARLPLHEWLVKEIKRAGDPEELSKLRKPLLEVAIPKGQEEILEALVRKCSDFRIALDDAVVAGLLEQKKAADLKVVEREVYDLLRGRGPLDASQICIELPILEDDALAVLEVLSGRKAIEVRQEPGQTEPSDPMLVVWKVVSK